jgi:ArsR family transcriptional regulator
MERSTTALIRQLKTLGDSTRLRLVALCRNGECSVSELVEVTGQSQPRISQHLKQLCEVGLLERFRDGKRMYYRVPRQHEKAALIAPLLNLLPDDDPTLREDGERLRQSRGLQVGQESSGIDDDGAGRALHRAILDLTVTTPIGDLLDVGCGRGAILKLLARRANRAVGVDIDASARQLARAELLLAGIPDCSLRKGDMYRLPFDDQEFNTIIIDDVLADARDPVRALAEARRLLRPGGRLFILESVVARSPSEIQARLAEWSSDAGLRLAPARLVPAKNPAWLVSVATTVGQHTEAA